MNSEKEREEKKRWVTAREQERLIYIHLFIKQ